MLSFREVEAEKRARNFHQQGSTMATYQNGHKQCSPVVVVMVPFPAQSHLNQILNLSHIISSYDIEVHYVGSALHNSQVRSRSGNRNPNPKIQFHDFPTPDFPSPPPNNTRFPSHLIPAFEASVHLRGPVKALLASLSRTSRRVVVMHDPLMGLVVQDSGSLPNTEDYICYCFSAISCFTFRRDAMGGFQTGDQPEIPCFEGYVCPEFEAFKAQQAPFMESRKSGSVFNTCRLIEGTFLDFLHEKGLETDENRKLWAIGPLETVTIFKNRPSKSLNSGQDKCLEWLNRQNPNSVLYVSFGTTTSMEDEQITELAVGLERSEAKFIWVLRDADKGDVFSTENVRRPQLPKRFEERVRGVGMVVRDWAPQLEILGHPSTGGFMTHCGWNSCLESMSLGVPLAAWPMHSDQPMNALLVTQVLKVGLMVREWEKRDELVSSSMINEVVRRLMSSEEGDEIRKRVEHLGDELRKSTAEGGVSRAELDSFIAHITRE